MKNNDESLGFSSGRQIKFRIWNGVDWLIPDEMELGGIIGAQKAGIVFQQFTGLKDKNGKEIYEGDICQLVHRADEGGGWYSDENERGVVYFDKNWGVKFDCRDATQRIANHWTYPAWSHEIKETHWSDSELYRDYHHIEVIGNIYENPQLIKKELS